MSALDAKLRESMQVELRQLQQRLGVTTFVVTHDQREAMTMADLVVVMGEGRIRQAASPMEIYRKPADAFVADFIGSTNLLDVGADGAGRASILGTVVPGLALPSGMSKGAVSIRPEDVHIGKPGDGIPGIVCLGAIDSPTWEIFTATVGDYGISIYTLVPDIPGDLVADAFLEANPG